MKKSELQQIILEEIKRITEGGDLILLKSIGMMIDEYTGSLYPKGDNFLYGEIEPGTSEYKKKMSKLSLSDKKIVDSLNL